jgi:hypothetical protein
LAAAVAAAATLLVQLLLQAMGVRRQRWQHSAPLSWDLLLLLLPRSLLSLELLLLLLPMLGAPSTSANRAVSTWNSSSCCFSWFNPDLHIAVVNLHLFIANNTNSKLAITYRQENYPLPVQAVKRSASGGACVPCVASCSAKNLRCAGVQTLQPTHRHDL